MGNRTTLGLVFFGLVGLCNVAWGACVVGQSSKTMNGYAADGSQKSVVITATACVPAGSDPKSFCNSRGASFFGIPSGGYACETKYPRGYQQICEDEFGYKAQGILGSTAKGSSYRTISNAELQACLSGKSAITQKPLCNPKEGTWKSSGGRDAFKACYCSDNDIANVSESECGEGIKCTSSNEVANPGTGGGCKCKDGYEYDSNKSCVAKQVAATPVQGVNQDLVNCVKTYEDEANLCASSAPEAKKTCDQANESNKEVQEAKNVPSQVINGFISAKAASGAQSECIKAGAISNGTKLLMDQMSATCNEQVKTCVSSCGGEDKVQAFIKECNPKLTAAMTADQQEDVNRGTSSASNPNLDYFKSHLDTIRQLQTTNTPLCKNDAKQNKDVLDGLLNGLAGAIQAGATCACKLASVAIGTGNCDRIPTQAECVSANYSLPGCGAYKPVDLCTTGSVNYSGPGCACANNPAGPNCGQIAATAANSGFAGADLTTPGGGDMSGFAPTNSKGGFDSEKIDLGSNNVNPLNETSKGGAGPGFQGGGAGGGGGGGGAVPGSGNEAAAGAGHEEGDGKGLMGAFSQAKSFMNSMLGGAKAPATTAKGGLNNKFDANKFKPGLRGVASGSEFAGKNKDIWKIVNDQYSDLQPSFISSP